MPKITKYFPPVNLKRATTYELTAPKLRPFDHIPNEILCYVFVYVASSTFGDPEFETYRFEDVRHLSSYWNDDRRTLERVCSRWFWVARSCSPLWSTIRYQYYWFGLYDSKYSRIWSKQISRTSRNAPLCLDITIAEHEAITDVIHINLVSHSLRLKSLRLVLDGNNPIWLLEEPFGLFLEPDEGRMSTWHTWPSFPPPPLTINSALHYLTRVEIIAIAIDYWDEDTRSADGWTYILLPGLSRLQHLSSLSLTGTPFRGPSLRKLASRVQGLPHSSRLPFHSLEELTLLEMDTACLAILGMMDLPNLRMLGILECREYEDPDDLGCVPWQLSYWERDNFPVSLPLVTHILLYNMTNIIVRHNYLLQRAPSVTHLVISKPNEPEEWTPEWLIWRDHTHHTDHSNPSLCPNLQELTVCWPRGKMRHFKAIVDSRLPTIRKLRIGEGQVERMERYGYWHKTQFASRDDASREILGDILEVMDCDFPHFEGEMARMRMCLTGRG